MMHAFENSVFYDVLLPKKVKKTSESSEITLERSYRYKVDPSSPMDQFDLVIFDFETTGLNVASDQIIEMGALRRKPDGTITEFSTLIDPGQSLPEVTTRICGITDDMLKGKPKIHEVMDKFLEFIEGGILVAHNADFDYPFLKQSCSRLGKKIDFPCFCTLKMSRKLLPDLESKSLDSLAKHYALEFIARHRSVGDCEVTLKVLENLLAANKDQFQLWKDFQPYGARNSDSK